MRLGKESFDECHFENSTQLTPRTLLAFYCDGPKKRNSIQVFYVWAAMTLIENRYLSVVGGMHSQQSGSIAPCPFLMPESNFAGRELSSGLGVRLSTPLGPMRSFHHRLLGGRSGRSLLTAAVAERTHQSATIRDGCIGLCPQDPGLALTAQPCRQLLVGWMVRAGGE